MAYFTDQQRPTAIVVDDDPAMRAFLGEALSASGCNCDTFADGASALSYLASVQQPPDLVMSDISMPGMSGIDLLRTVKAVSPDLPFILISGSCEMATAIDAVRVGAADYLLKPARKEDIIRLVTRHIVGQATPSQDAMLKVLSEFLSSRLLSGGDSASLLAPLFEMFGLKRLETLQHSQRVAGITRLMGVELGLGTKELEALEIGSLLHDIGKAAIPHNVLMKPGKLTEREQRVMRMHPVIGWELLNRLRGVKKESEIVYCHHEQYGGGGYPRGLAKDEIPIGARIFAIADTLDAIVSNRVYRRGAPLSKARQEISRYSGTQFDPALVLCFEQISDERIEYLRMRFQDPEQGD